MDKGIKEAFKFDTPSRPGLAALVRLGQRCPLLRALLEPESGVDEVDVDLVHAEPVEALIEGAQGLGGGFVTVLHLRPQLGGEEHIAALDAGLLRADAQFFADDVVIGVDLGGVDVPIPGREGVPDGGRSLLVGDEGGLWSRTCRAAASAGRSGNR
ncbi:hypothetical protein ACWDXT_31200 [Streptomyces sp. NPDC003236]|uniref:hypothetical protein n=1 Tax=Streptomyces TaxID=1883 RepID=UPI0013CE5691|nr:hypothetical protein [Streptomyces sp. Tu 4128]